MVDDLVKIFKDTYDKSLSDYKKETDILVTHKTFIYEPQSLFIEKNKKKSDIKLINCDSVTACIKLAKDSKKIAVLNFADPETPGGAVTYGAKAQEECLCRCSNLYQSLTSADCKEWFYDYNKRYYYDGKNTDCIIYSEGVTFFKDADYDLLSIPVTIDVITCPAPRKNMNKKEALFTYIQRIKSIFAAAFEHNIEILILGAWGCGAFNQDPTLIAKSFKKAIKLYGGNFEKIVFAIPRTEYDSNFDVFKSELKL